MERIEFKRLVLSKAAKRDWKARDIARALNLSDGAVSHFLNGQTDSVDMAEKICALLGIPERFARLTCDKPLPDACQEAPADA